MNLHSHKPFKGWVRVLLILPFLFIVGLFQMIGFFVLGLKPTNFNVSMNPFQNMVVSLFSLGGTFLIVYIFRHNIDEEDIQSMGFYLENIRWESITGLIIGFLILTVGFGLLIGMHEIQWTGITLNLSSLLFSLILLLAVAIYEELYFRGYILNNLMKSMPRAPALAVSSIIFSVFHIFNLHYSWFSFLDLVLAGLLLGLPYIYTKSLWLPISLHFSWNFFQGPIFGFNVSGQETYSLISQTRISDNLLNGGAFGFEGSVVSMAIQLITILVLLRFYRKREIGTKELSYKKE